MPRPDPNRPSAASAPTATGEGLPIDLSAAPDSDPDSIYNSATASSLTLNKSGSGHTSPAVWNLRELADGETVVMRLQHGAPTGASKAWFGVGITSGTDTYVAGINAHGSSVAQPLDFDGTTVTYVGLFAAEDTTWITLHRRGTKVQMRAGPKFYDADGTAIQVGAAETEFTVSGTVNIVAMVGLNDTTGGTVAIPYAGAYGVLAA